MVTSSVLKRVITSTNLVYQPINCLIDVADDINIRNTISSQINDNNWSILSKKEASDIGFEELTKWSTQEDYLIAIELEKPINDEYYVLVCLPKKSFH